MGTNPEIEFFDVFCITDNDRGDVRVLGFPKGAAAAE